MAKAMVRSEQHHILLLREWERCVLSRWKRYTSLFINIKDRDIEKLWILSSKFRQGAERLLLYQWLQCRVGPQLTQGLQEEFMLRDECSWKTFLPGSTHTNAVTLLITVAVCCHYNEEWEYSLQINNDSFSLQFTASSPREAREWVDQINFVLKGMWDMKYIFIVIHTIFYIMLNASDLSQAQRWSSWCEKGSFIKRGIPITFRLAQPIR